MSGKVATHQDLEVYRRAFEAASKIYELSRAFPRDEAYSLTDQIRRSSRSVCANMAEAWRKRRYEAAFVSKLSEAAETQVWLEFAVKCGYLNAEVAATLYREYNAILGTIVGMIIHREKWVLPKA